MPNIYFLDRDGLEYYHDNTSLMFLGKRYNIAFTGDYNVNQTTSARLVLQDELTVSSDQAGIEFPTVSCVATVTPNGGYAAGTATVTRSGNTFTVNVMSAHSLPSPVMNIQTNDIASGATEEITVTVGGGVYEATGTVTVIVNGEEYTSALSNGEATFSITGLTAEPGLVETYTASVTYSGDSNYASVTDSATFSVFGSQSSGA